MIDVYIETYTTPPEGFTDNLYNQLTRYIFELNRRETHEKIRLDVSNCITQFWPEYPLGMVLVDALSLNDVNITIKVKDDNVEEICEVNYECDYYIDCSAESYYDEIYENMEPGILSTNDILYGIVENI
jgi:hypothetical protein